MKLLHLLTLASTASAFVAPLVRSSSSSSSSTTTTARPMIGGILDLLSGGDPGMVSPDKALPGRKQKMPNITGLRHYVLGNDLETVPEGHKVAGKWTPGLSTDSPITYSLTLVISELSVRQWMLL